MGIMSFDSCVIARHRQGLATVLTLGLMSCGGSNINAPPPPPGPPPPSIPGWSSLASLPAPVGLHAAALFRGQVYVAGGQDANLNPIRTVFRYDPPADEWTQLNDLPATRFNMGMVVVNDTLYVVAGEQSVDDARRTLWAYLPDTDEWVARAPLPEAQGDGAVGALGDKIVVAAGIRDFPLGPVGIFHDSVMIYSQTANEWRKGPRDLTPRRGTRGTVVGQKLYAFGGIIPALAIVPATAEVFDGDTETWTQLASMLGGRSLPGVAALGGKIHLFGGGPGPTVDHQVYDIATDSWTTMLMPTGRVGAAAVTLPDGRILVIGGFTVTGMTTALDVFTPQ